MADHPMDKQKGKAEREFNRVSDPLRARKGEAKRAFNEAARPPEKNPPGPELVYPPPQPGLGPSPATRQPRASYGSQPRGSDPVEAPRREKQEVDPLLARKGEAKRSFDKAALSPATAQLERAGQKPPMSTTPVQSSSGTRDHNLKAAFDRAKNKNKLKQQFQTRSKLP
jgi:hypothetical protein